MATVMADAGSTFAVSYDAARQRFRAAAAAGGAALAEYRNDAAGRGPAGTVRPRRPN